MIEDSPLRVLFAYVTVVLIWSTTPLAIKWSGEGPGYLFGVTSRMLIGWILVLSLLAVTRQPLPLNRKALRNYLAVSGHIYASMLAVYWASQYIPSGWIAVIFGLTPMLTAVLATLTGERLLTLSRLAAYVLGLGGLTVIFGSALAYNPRADLGILGVLVAAFLQAASAVGVKRINADLPALAQVGGGLTLAVPAYLLTWAARDGGWPTALPITSLASIAYLGLIATPLGFALYLYVLKHLAATQVALITLITPVMALLLGRMVNHEPITFRVVLGTGLILAAVFIHEFRFVHRLGLRK